MGTNAHRWTAPEPREPAPDYVSLGRGDTGAVTTAIAPGLATALWQAATDVGLTAGLERPSGAQLDPDPCDEVQLAAVREAVGEAWVSASGGDLAAAIRTKTRALEELAALEEEDPYGPALVQIPVEEEEEEEPEPLCSECGGAGTVEVVPHAGTSICDPGDVREVPCPECTADDEGEA